MSTTAPKDGKAHPMTDVEKLIESVKCEALVLTDQAELVSALRRLALAEKVVEAAAQGPCRHTADITGETCRTCIALRAYDAAKEAQ